MDDQERVAAVLRRASADRGAAVPGDALFWRALAEAVREVRWHLFDEEERAELGIALDHRVGEAEQGSAYARWQMAGKLMLEEMRASEEDPEEIREQTARLVALDQKENG